MNKLLAISILALLSACGSDYKPIDNAYVKDCNDRGGRVERIEYSREVQCIGANAK